jgi:DNA polymerase-3 subunit alpha
VGADEKVDTIRFGLKAIKNVGEHIAEAIIQERKERGAFKDLADFLERVNDKDLNKKSLESLIKTGALDQFEKRGMLLSNIENLLKFSKDMQETKISRQNSLFGDMPAMTQKVRLDIFPDADRQTKLAWERELMGLYITEHPFADYRKILDGKINLAVISELKKYLYEDSVKIGGFITTIKKIQTRSNESMLFVKIEDNTGNAEILVFPKLLKETSDIWKEGRAIICQGKVSDKDNEIKLLANFAAILSLENIDAELDAFKRKLMDMPANNGRKFYANGNGNGSGYGKADKNLKQAIEPKIAVSNPLKLIFLGEMDEGILVGLRKIFTENPGNSKVYFKINHGSDKIIETGFSVGNLDDLKAAIKSEYQDIIQIVD